MWLHFRGTKTPHYQSIPDLHPERWVINLPPDAFAQLEVLPIYQFLEQGHSLDNLLCASAKLRLLLAHIHQLRISTANRETQMAGDSICASTEWMHRNIHFRATLSKLASLAAFSVLFRKKTGYSPIDYFLRLKIQRASELLDTTSLRITKIAARADFEDPYYFARLFRKITGRSPRAYQNISKG